MTIPSEFHPPEARMSSPIGTSRNDHAAHNPQNARRLAASANTRASNHAKVMPAQYEQIKNAAPLARSSNDDHHTPAPAFSGATVGHTGGIANPVLKKTQNRNGRRIPVMTQRRKT